MTIDCAPALTIAISTIASRCAGISLPGPVSGVSYLVIVQGAHAPIPRKIQLRGDVRVVRSDTHGLSRSRNIALAEASGDLLLLADDDLTFEMQGILEARDQMARSPDIAILTGVLLDEAGAPLKSYPTGPKAWSVANSGRVGSPEIMLRLSPVRDAGLRFDEAFGAGSLYPSGEEYIFITDAMKAGLETAFAPNVIARHPNPRTGSDWSDEKLLLARRKVLTRVFGRLAPLARIVYAVRKRRLLGWRGALRFLLR